MVLMEALGIVLGAAAVTVGAATVGLCLISVRPPFDVWGRLD